jgi:hypothetical protein
VTTGVRTAAALVAALSALSCGESLSSKAPPAKTCPAKPPADGAPCSGALVCDYPGARPGLHCRAAASCVGGRWFVQAASSTCGQVVRPCPATFALLADGDPCPIEFTGNGVDAGFLSGACDYDEGRCQCVPCQKLTFDTGHMWSCRRWDSGGPGCPPLSPVPGTACSVPDQLCDYDGCGRINVGYDSKCIDGQWGLHATNNVGCAIPQCSAATQ